MTAEKPSAVGPVKPPSEPMTTHQKVIVAVLAFLQFTVMVDFMILGPLGAKLIDELDIDTKQFGLTVSAYALSAGLASFSSAAIVDRFDRKKLLLVVYTGFIAGTLLCGVAPTYEFLLVARIVAGVFGGVLVSISMTIVADVFPLSMRGRAMGSMMTAFSGAQIAGVPAGLALSNAWGWHAPFLVIAGLGAVVGVGVAFVLGPLDAHLKASPAAGATTKPNPLAHMARTATKPAYLQVFATTVLLSSGFMVMPLLSAFFVGNLHIAHEDLPLIFMATGAVTFVMGPLAGKLADSIGKLTLFAIGSALACAVFVIWATLSGPTSLWIVLLVNCLMYVGNTRMIAVGVLTSAVPAPSDRGAFLSMNASVQQVSGGLAAFAGGLIVVAQPDGTLARFDTLCVVVIALIIAALLPVWLIDRRVKAQQRT